MDIIKTIKESNAKTEVKGNKYIIDIIDIPADIYFIIQYHFDESGAIIYSYLESVIYSKTNEASRKELLKKYLPSLTI